MRRAARRVAIGAALLASLVLVVLVAAWFTLRASLPKLGGRLAVAGIEAPVGIERDALGVPTIEAAGLDDLAYALGFLHAQDRFFQMDLLRRGAAGELSALFGSVALDYDRSVRIHRFRARAERAAAREDPLLLRRATRYRDGVNAGLEALGSKPFEYWLLRTSPRPWSVEDSYLVLYAMFLDLQEARAATDRARTALAEAVDAEWYAFLLPEWTPFDAPLDGAPGDWPRLPSTAAPFDVGATARDGGEPAPRNGSNAFAVGGERSAHGGAILASDMHLGLRLPALWYRARLRWADGDAVGLTLPGAPALVAGSNGHVAWGFTNGYADAADLVRGSQVVARHFEIIDVAGAGADTLIVEETEHGPRLEAGGDEAVAWVAHHPEAADFRLLRLLETRTLDAALALLPRCGIPVQNAIVVDAEGNLGWTLAGRVPLRRAGDGRFAWNAGDDAWVGLADPGQMPLLRPDASGLLWSGNARALPPTRMGPAGDGGYALGARAGQLRDRLLALADAREGDLLGIQLDDRARFFDWWRALLLRELLRGGRHAELAAVVEQASGRAAVDDAAHRWVRAFRGRVRAALLARWVPPDVVTADLPPQTEAALRVAIEARDERLIAGNSWDDLFDAVIDALVESVDEPPAAWTWGRRNTLDVAHPLAASLGSLGDRLRMPRAELPGDRFLPRVQGPRFGASARFVVSPGREASGIMHLPGGISGHPLSPWFLAGHDDWVEGNPTPLLPGEPEHRLELVPAR